MNNESVYLPNQRQQKIKPPRDKTRQCYLQIVLYIFLHKEI